MTTLCELRTSEITLGEVVAAVAHPSAGAVTTFLGLVRDHNDGRAVTLLEYEAYASMAEREMRRIVEELEREVRGVRLAVLHRVGRLEIGDVAIACAASSAHRGEAFRAGKALIDRIKERVPIWKREHGPDGPYWVGWQDARCTDPDHEHGAHERGAHEHGAVAPSPKRGVP